MFIFDDPMELLIEEFIQSADKFINDQKQKQS